MPHVMSFFDHDWTKSWDLMGKEVTVTITKVQAGVLEDQKRKKKDRKPVISMKGWPKPLALNKTNVKTIMGMYGPKTEDWIGKRITLYPTTTQFGNETHDCIRVRPTVPTKQGEAAPAASLVPPSDAPADPREPGAEG